MANNRSDKLRATSRPHDWTDVLAPEIIKQFVGKHIAIIYKRVIASGTSYDRVLEECIRLFPDETPYMAYIPTPEEALDEESATQASNVQQPSAFEGRYRPAYSQPTQTRRDLNGGPNGSIEEEYVDEDESVEDDDELETTGYRRSRESSDYYDDDSTIRSITPSAGPVGTIITITGQDFTGITEVHFNGTLATTFNLTSETSLSVVVPEGATSGVVSVKTPRGVDFSRPGFHVVPPPAITSFSPAAGGVGTRVTIKGESLAGTNRVSFTGASQPTISALTDTSLSVVVPFGTQTGPITVAAPGGTATSEESFMLVRPPKIIGFSDFSGGVGSSITIDGTDLSDALAVKFGGVPSPQFTVNSPTSITAVIPSGAITGLISITTPGGLTAGTAQFTVIPAPIISSISPEAGVVGTVIAILGSNFDGVERIDFGGIRAKEPVFVSSDRVNVEVPEGAVSGPVTLVTRGGTSVGPRSYDVIPFPVIDSFNPSAAGAGAEIIIRGSGLLNASRVSFGSLDTDQYTVESASVVRAIVPGGAPSGLITVATPGGISSSVQEFEYIPEPHVYSISPTAAGLGASVKVEGNNLGGALSVAFGAVNAEVFTESSDSTLTVTVPDGAENGDCPITVVTLGGVSTSDNVFTVVYPPVIESVRPEIGPAGTAVEVTGYNFTKSTVVKFNGVEATDVAVLSSTELKTVVPRGSETGFIQLLTVGGSAKTDQGFIVLQPPIISSFSPASAGAGAPVEVIGQNFADASQVRFNGLPTAFHVASTELLTARVPGGAASGTISVTTPGGVGESESEFIFIQEPSIASVEPMAAPAAAQVILHGSNFSGATRVTLNGLNVAEFVVLSDSSISVRLTLDAADGLFLVSTPGGAAQSTSEFKIIPPPTVHSLAPESAGVGQSISIYGTDLMGALRVTFNGIEAEGFIVESDSVITADVPSGSTSGKVVVETIAGTASPDSEFTLIPLPAILSLSSNYDAIGSEITIYGEALYDVLAISFGTVNAPEYRELSSSAIAVTVPVGAESGALFVTTRGGKSLGDVYFTVAHSPEITGFSPTIGKVGTQVTISGANFTESSLVKFDNAAATDIVVISDTIIEAVVPAGAFSGFVFVSAVGGSVMSDETFTVLQPPTIESFSPLATGAGKTITITGTDFTDIVEVRVNDLAARFSPESATILYVEVPARASSGPITIVTPGGTGQSFQEFTFVEPPIISGFEPTVAAAGATVHLTGVYFSGATRVVLGDKDVADFIVVSDTAIAARLGDDSSSGFFGVVTSGGKAVSDFDFKLIPAPVISSVSPAAAGAG